MELSMKPDLSGKVVVVTGGAGVLCTAFVKAIAECGAKIAIADLTVEKAQALSDELNAQGADTIAVQMNVLEPDSIKAAHQVILDKFGKCDILINGAGGNNPRATTNDEFFDKEQFESPEGKCLFEFYWHGVNFVFGLNFNGTLLPTQEFAKDMLGNPGGVILNISSMNAFTPLTKIPAYSGAKAAISNFTKWLAVYFSKEGIRVNAIAPGFFSTAQNKALLWNPDGTPTARTEKILRNTPMGRFGEPEELIGTLLWLLDNKSSGFVTGVVVPVDGGFSAYSGV